VFRGARRARRPRFLFITIAPIAPSAPAAIANPPKKRFVLCFISFVGFQLSFQILKLPKIFIYFLHLKQSTRSHVYFEAQQQKTFLQTVRGAASAIAFRPPRLVNIIDSDH
jgi:hypothetical protein